MSDVTCILERAQPVDPKTADELLPLVYDELRALAAQKLSGEKPGQTLQATALVHEAWLRLTGTDPGQWNSRGHFFAAAAEAMRRILIEGARRKQRLKHGGNLERVDVTEVQLPLPMQEEQLLALDAALDRLNQFNARSAEVVKLMFFIGLTQEQTAHELGVSLSTIERLWSFARTWLYREMQKDGGRSLLS